MSLIASLPLDSRDRLPLYQLTRAYHARLAAISRGGGDLRRRLLAAAMAVMVNVGRAADPSRSDSAKTLQKARDAIDTSLLVLDGMLNEARLENAAAEEARKAASLLTRWIIRLASIPVANWIDTSFSEDETANPDDGGEASLRSTRWPARRDVSNIVKLLQEMVSSAPSTSRPNGEGPS